MGGVAGASGGWKVADIAFDTDVEFYSLNGDSVANTVADIEDVMNGVSMIYENQLGISYEITTIIVRTTEPDPYSATVAAEMGEATTPRKPAITLIDSGRSGRTPAFLDTSAITGNRA